jgi:hypothetical protein
MVNKIRRKNHSKLKKKKRSVLNKSEKRSHLLKKIILEKHYKKDPKEDPINLFINKASAQRTI